MVVSLVAQVMKEVKDQVIAVFCLEVVRFV